MDYECAACGWIYKDEQEPIPLAELYSKRVPLLTHCEKCHAVCFPQHLTDEEMEYWFILNAKCRNAWRCYKVETYRAECEACVFYPGCLTFVHNEFHQMWLVLQNVLSLLAKR